MTLFFIGNFQLVPRRDENYCNGREEEQEENITQLAGCTTYSCNKYSEYNSYYQIHHVTLDNLSKITCPQCQLIWKRSYYAF